MGKWLSQFLAEYQDSLSDIPDTMHIVSSVSVPEALEPDKKFLCQPAAPNAKAIYWETGDGRILGPAVPEFLGRDGNTFWISTTFDGRIWWINADRLRSHKAFVDQREVREVEAIR